MKDRLAENSSKLADVDLRNFMAPQTSPEKSCKILITPDDEQSIKADKLTVDQKNALWNKVIAQMNNGDNTEGLGNISLQPISDEEMEGDFSEGEEATAAAAATTTTTTTTKKTIPFGDKDDRVPPLHNMSQGGDYQKAPFYNRGRAHPTWRGRRPPKYYDGPHARPGPRPPIRPEGPWTRNVGAAGNWRPMGPTQNYPRGPANVNYHRTGVETAEFVQDAAAPDAVIDNVSNHLKGRQSKFSFKIMKLVLYIIVPLVSLCLFLTNFVTNLIRWCQLKIIITATNKN